MNETYHPASASDVPGSASGLQSQAPYTSMPPGSDKTASAEKLGESASPAGKALHAKTDQLRQSRGEWAEGVRGAVRSNPLASLAAALALGAAFARITRRGRP